jgi:hypothetical protein
MPLAGERAERRVRSAYVLDLHADGNSLRDIAGLLNVTLARARKLLADAIASMPAQDVEELRATSELRLDRAARNFAELMNDPDPRIRLQAAQGVLATERDRARLLGTWQKPPPEQD